MNRAFLFTAIAPLATLLALGASAHAGNPNVVVSSDPSSMPAFRYAEMNKEACLKELSDRKVPFRPAGTLEGVDAPVRITGPIHGVLFEQVNRTSEEALNSDSSVLDCRLLLAIDDFSEQLAEQGVEKVGFINAFRHDDPSAAGPRERHPAGLAMDVTWLRRKDGHTLDVERDFVGHIGAKTCGRGAQLPPHATQSTRDLRKIVCDASAMHLFNVLLTPNYDRGHYNHLHLEVRRNIRWYLVQ